MTNLMICFVLQAGAIVSTFISIWLIGGKRLSGLWWGQAANVFWFALYFTHGLYGLLIVPAVLFVLYARALVQWGRA